ncbi:hypothetical protein [Burkholderia cenocepacia]|uniref:hypothetical protein n=1 Tax=Burkholderia cenocepacia TaxID=95486 RepID=UPI00264E30F4|nr:hypothetical protein [Burkholderia cenocepacia]MDN7683027.1 hypothetical protein [Burkholderia cenocepacia]
MIKNPRSLCAIFQQSVPIAITISSMAASACLAVSGLAPLWGSPGNITSEAIGTVVHFVAYKLAWGNEEVANIWLLQAPIALITYILINTVPIAVGALAIELWKRRYEELQTSDANITP